MSKEDKQKLRENQENYHFLVDIRIRFRIQRVHFTNLSIQLNKQGKY